MALGFRNYFRLINPVLRILTSLQRNMGGKQSCFQSETSLFHVVYSIGMQKEDEMFSNGIPNIFAGYRILTGFESLNILPDIVESNRFENSIVYTYIHELKNPL